MFLMATVHLTECNISVDTCNSKFTVYLPHCFGNRKMSTL